MEYVEAKKQVHDLIACNKHLVRKSFPQIMWKRLRNDIPGLASFPENPPCAYKEWRSWSEWLGSDIYSQLDIECDSLNEIALDDFSLEECSDWMDIENLILEPQYIDENSRYDIEFNRKLKSLYEHYQATATLSVSLKDNKDLANWVNTQRSLRKREMLKPERVSALDSINFDWDPQINLWDVHFNDLVSYHAKFGHSAVGARDKKHGRLGTWVRQQRMYCRWGTLSKDKKARLNSLGFLWEVPEDIRYTPVEGRKEIIEAKNK